MADNGSIRIKGIDTNSNTVLYSIIERMMKKYGFTKFAFRLQNVDLPLMLCPCSVTE